MHNCVHDVRAVLHLNVDDYEGLENRAVHCLCEILRTLAGGNKVGVTLSHTGATRALQRYKGEGERWVVGGWRGRSVASLKLVCGGDGGREGRK